MSKKTREERAAKLARQLQEFGGQRNFQCPSCSKWRLKRPHDHKIDLEKRDFETYEGNTVSLLIDVCEPCAKRNQEKYFEPSQDDMKQLLKDMHRHEA